MSRSQPQKIAGRLSQIVFVSRCTKYNNAPETQVFFQRLNWGGDTLCPRSWCGPLGISRSRGQIHSLSKYMLSLRIFFCFLRNALTFIPTASTHPPIHPCIQPSSHLNMNLRMYVVFVCYLFFKLNVLFTLNVFVGNAM